MAQWPGVPAWPITQPVCLPMKVTEVGRKWGGTRGPDTAVGRDDADGSGVLLPWPPAGVAEEEQQQRFLFGGEVEPPACPIGPVGGEVEANVGVGQDGVGRSSRTGSIGSGARGR